MKKKILFIIHSVYGGGAEKRTKKILENLNQTKFEPCLCVFYLTGKENLRENIPVYDLSTKLRPASFFLIWKLIKLIKKTKPDKIFSTLGNTNLIALMASMFTNTPVIINEAADPSGDTKLYSFSPLRKILMQLLYVKSLLITTVSEYTRNDLIKNFKLPENKITAIPTGINIKAIEELSKKYSVKNEKYILACGALSWRKNHNLLIEAAGQLKNTPLIILGTGTQKASLASKAKTLGVNLILPGHIDNPYPYFKNAEFFVLTSFYEGLPNVLLEAIALKTPVISVDCPGGIKEIIKHGETGLIVPQNNKQALANALQNLMENPDMGKKLAQNAYDNLNKKFTFKKMMEQYEEALYL